MTVTVWGISRVEADAFDPTPVTSVAYEPEFSVAAPSFEPVPAVTLTAGSATSDCAAASLVGAIDARTNELKHTTARFKTIADAPHFQVRNVSARDQRQAITIFYKPSRTVLNFALHKAMIATMRQQLARYALDSNKR
ncbi:MAG: hypothetical protein BGP08_15370 [Rhizobiales bacterium 64-17]|nr:MAG: hypothetical protein BGP08_15370 [Rhizobiales bacterium 64-17]